MLINLKGTSQLLHFGQNSAVIYKILTGDVIQTYFRCFPTSPVGILHMRYEFFKHSAVEAAEFS